MKIQRAILVLTCLGILCSSSVSHADIFDGVIKALNIEEADLQGVLGIGVFSATQPYQDVDAQVWAVPLVSLKYKNFWIDGKVLGYRLYEHGDLSFSIAGQPRLMGYESDDSTALRGMEDRDGSFDGGARVSWGNEYFDVDVTAVSDLGGTHEGQEISVIFSKELFKGFLTPRAGFKWLSDSLVDYYFGVRGTETRVGRPAYEPGSTVDAVVGATLAFPMGDKWAFITDIEYEPLGSEIADSPIVDADGIFKYVVGVVRRF